MRLQSASRKEIRRIASGTGICSALLIAVFFLLSLLGIGTLDYRVVIGAAAGSLVAVLNFMSLCLTVQKAVTISDQKQMKAFIQGSYHGRLLLQAGWIAAAFMSSHIHVLAAAVPLLFPGLVIFTLQPRSPRGRGISSAKEQTPPEDRPNPFGV